MADSQQKVTRTLPWPWTAGILFLCIILLGLLMAFAVQAQREALSVTAQVTFWLVCLGELIGILYLVRLLVHFRDRLQQVEQQYLGAEQRMAQSVKHLDALFRVSQKFVEAADEREVIDLVLRLSIELVGAKGATYVPLDDHGQPLGAISQGQLPSPGMEAWIEYLATPEVRNACQACRKTELATHGCPLLVSPTINAESIFCMPLGREEHEFGVLNLYLPGEEPLSGETHAILGALVDQTALALEGVRLRRRELLALRQMQSVRQKTDLNASFTIMLENVSQSVASDFAMLVIAKKDSSQTSTRLLKGTIPGSAQPFVDGVTQGVIASGQPVLLGEVTGDSASGPSVHSLLAVPLISTDRSACGALVVGNQRSVSFHKRQLALLQTIAGQVSLVVQNADALADLEYHAMIQERTRLAREIHDGLAQTLGFLKLQAAQMRNYLSRGEADRARQSLDVYYTALTEAYQDVRQTIDGLRIEPTSDGLNGWLEQAVAEFSESSGLPVELADIWNAYELAPEVHAQLIRIVLEALANIRKHAQASHVRVSCIETGGDLILEIRDDGIGFPPEQVARPSQHGLRGMRERSELIGADFQIVSLPKEGTTVRLRLPLRSQNTPQDAR